MVQTPVYSLAQMKAWEDQQNAAGLTYEQMMTHAGSRAAQDLLARFEAPQCAVVLCGRGNNGGDGLVMARVLCARAWRVRIVLLQGRDLAPLGQLNLARLPDAVQQIPPVQLPAAWSDTKVVIDAVYGTGFHGALPAAVAVCFDAVRVQPQLYKVALDMPSGIHGDTAQVAEHAFSADLTYALQALKPAHLVPEAAAHCGDIVRIDLC